MKKLTYIIIIICALGLTRIETHAQRGKDRYMTLEETVDLALKQNWQVRKSEEQLGMASGELRETSQAFLPQVRFSETYTTTNDPLAAFGFRLKQSSIVSEDFEPGSLNHPERITNYTTRFEVQQPIVNLDGVASRKAANASLQASKEQLNWAQNLTRLQAKHNYYQLQLAGKELETVSHALETAKANHGVARDLAEQGLISQADLLKAELRVTEVESTLLSARNNIIRFNGELVHFLNLPADIRIIPVDSIRLQEVPYELLTIDQISKDRSDLRALALQLEASNKQLKSSRSSFLPRLSAFGRYELNDTRPFGSQSNNYQVGGQLQWDLFKGSSRIGKLQKETARRNITELAYEEKLSSGQRQLVQVQNEVRLARKKVEVSELAMKQAREAYVIRFDRYLEGLEKTSDLLTAESTLLEKKLNNIKSLNEYQQSVFHLELLLEKEIIIQ